MRTLCLLLVALASCATPPNRLAHVDVQSVTMKTGMAYEVWAPPDHNPNLEQLPLMVFLHGGGDDENSFDNAGIGQHLDAELAAGRIPRVVIVVPRGENGFWENWQDGSRRYRDWVMTEVIPAVQVEYRTAPCPANCHVAGVSMGGHGTLRFAWFHGEQFATASALSAPIFDADAIQDFTGRWYVRLFIPVDRVWGSNQDRARIESEDLYRQWQKQSDLRGLRLLLAVAEKDRGELILLNRKFHAHLKEIGIEHEYFEFPGRHKWVSWTPVIDQVLRFAVWGKIDPPPVKSAPPAPSPSASEPAESATPSGPT